MTTYLTDSEGKFIPATQRPDGTWRKARRVKDGYVPQEEVPLYESKGKQFANKSKSDLPVGMCPLVAQAAKDKREKAQKKSKSNPIPGVIVLPNGAAAANKSSSRSSQSQPSTSTTTNPRSSKDVDSVAAAVESLDIAGDDSQDSARKIKKLKKKIREIETIEAKLKSGDLKKPEKDQLDKVKRKQEILKEIKDLENNK